jgi:hypothetical protein
MKIPALRVQAIQGKGLHFAGRYGNQQDATISMPMHG